MLKSKRRFVNSEAPSLPKEILYEIFSYLDAAGLCAVYDVCKNWRCAASDKRLWLQLYSKVGKCNSEIFANHKSIKEAVITAATSKRNAKCSKMRRYHDPLSGTAGLHSEFLTFVKPTFRIEFLQKDGSNISFKHNDVFPFKSVIQIRFYCTDFEVPLQYINTICVKALTPLFITDTGARGPCQSSLLLEVPFKQENINSATLVASDELINLHKFTENVIVAFWKRSSSNQADKTDGNNIAFITVTIPAHNFVERCLTANKGLLSLLPAAKPLTNTLEAFSNELSRFSCFFELRNVRETFWTEKMNPKVLLQGDSAVLSVIDRSLPNLSWAIKKDNMDFLWKTDLFKGRMPNLCFVDFVLLDVDNKPVAFFSSLAKFVEVDERTYDYSDGKMLRLVAADKSCEVLIEIFQEVAEHKFYVRHAQVRLLNVDVIFNGVSKDNNKKKGLLAKPLNRLNEDMAAYVELYNEEAKKPVSTSSGNSKARPAQTAASKSSSRRSSIKSQISGNEEKW